MPESSETAPPAAQTTTPDQQGATNEALRFSAVATGQQFEVPVLALQNINLFPETVVPLGVGRPRSVAALESALATVFEESELCIEFAPDARHFRDTLSKPENVKFVREACREITGNEIGIRIVVKDPQAEGQPLSREDEARLEKQRLRELAENSPIVQQMLKTFRGEIVDVRRDGER